MKLKVIGKILGLLLIFLAFYYFDRHSLLQTTVSFLLLSVGLDSLTADLHSKFFRKAVKVIRLISLVLAVILILRALTGA